MFLIPQKHIFGAVAFLIAMAPSRADVRGGAIPGDGDIECHACLELTIGWAGSEPELYHGFAEDVACEQPDPGSGGSDLEESMSEEMFLATGPSEPPRGDLRRSAPKAHIEEEGEDKGCRACGGESRCHFVGAWPEGWETGACHQIGPCSGSNNSEELLNAIENDDMSAIAFLATLYPRTTLINRARNAVQLLTCGGGVAVHVPLSAEQMDALAAASGDIFRLRTEGKTWGLN